jgi:hypothetical protein
LHELPFMQQHFADSEEREFAHELSPGSLCFEALAEHSLNRWDLRVIFDGVYEKGAKHPTKLRLTFAAVKSADPYVFIQRPQAMHELMERNRLVKHSVDSRDVGFRQAKLVRIEPPRQRESVQRHV